MYVLLLYVPVYVPVKCSKCNSNDNPNVAKIV